MSKLLSQIILRELLHYDRNTGVFTWIKRRGSSHVSVGEEAGYIDTDGYRKICVAGERHKAHRLAFLYVEGRFPDRVDHRNSIRSDNRWPNLREVTPSQNTMNRKSASKHGFKGATFDKKCGRWRAYMGGSANIKRTILGYFDTGEEAARAYDAAARERYGEFAKLNFPDKENGR